MRNDRLTAIVYPNARNAADRVHYAYLRTGQISWKQDRNGTQPSYYYDLLGRLVKDFAECASGIDESVTALALGYTLLGQTQNITSLSASSQVVNDVHNVYNGFGQLIAQYQEHNGPVDTATTLKVQYTYADGTANTIRLTGIVYPHGRLINYAYSSPDNSALSRLYSISDASATISTYSYLGLRRCVHVDYPEPAVQYDLVNAGCPCWNSSASHLAQSCSTSYPVGPTGHYDISNPLGATSKALLQQKLLGNPRGFKITRHGDPPWPPLVFRSCAARYLA